MNIPTEAKAKWESLKQHGDIGDIVTESGFSRDTIKLALDGDECSVEVFEAIQTFYNKRQQTVDSLMNPHREIN
jgi:hypothetical protein